MEGPDGADKVSPQGSDAENSRKGTPGAAALGKDAEVRIDAATDVSAARAAAGEELGQTIVTGVKIKIDPTTGKLSLEAGAGGAELDPKVAALLAASAAVAPAAITPAAITPATATPATATPAPTTPPVEPASVEIASAPPGKADQETPAPVEAKPAAEPQKKEEAAASGNRRLSAETLFAFALPEAVVNAADEALKVQTQNNIPAPKVPQKDSTTVKRTLVGTAARAKGQTALVLGGAAVALCVALYLLFGRSPDEIVTTKEPVGTAAEVTKAPAVVEKTSNAPADAVAGSSDTANAAKQPVTAPDNAAVSGSTAAALKAFDTPDARALADAIQEGIKTKDDKVVEQILAQSSNPSVFVRVAVAKALFEKDAYSAALRGKVVAALVQLLDDKDYLVRGYAARALGGTRDKTVLPKLTARLTVETEEVVKKLLRSAIEQLKK